MKLTLALISLVLLISSAAFADIPRPEPTKKLPKAKSVETQLDIRLNHLATEAVLVIPKSQLTQLRAELEDLDNEDDTTAAVTDFGRMQTLVSGAFLSLALVFGGVWFVRSGKAATKGGKSLVILATIAAIGSAATLVYANIGPPPGSGKITGRQFSDTVREYGYFIGKIKVEVGDGDRIVLTVPNPQDKPADE